MTTRGKFQGMWMIGLFNWPLYLLATIVLAISVAALFFVPAGSWRWLCVFTSLAALHFLLVSSLVSHLIYDRSDLYRWGWLNRALSGVTPERIIFCHCGFDETSEMLKEKFLKSAWLLLDHFEEDCMTEGSIRRARRIFPPCAGTVTAPYNRWPAASAHADVIFGLLAIHELRGETERRDWFREAGRCLNTGGRIILAEHTRDTANFLAFGPGFLHFHSPGSWRRSWEQAGLRCHDEFRVTPWVRVFVIGARDGTFLNPPW